ncbi:unnamed protein product [Closterium sp. NIES-54]
MALERVLSWPVGLPYASAAVFPIARLGRVAIFVLSRPRMASDPFSARRAPRGTRRCPQLARRAPRGMRRCPARRAPRGTRRCPARRAPCGTRRCPYLQLTRRAPRGKRRAFPHPLSLQPPLTYPPRHMVAALRLSTRPPPPPLSPCSRGGEGMGVAGVGALGHFLPFPSSSFRSHCCSCRWGGGCEGVGEKGEWHRGGGCEATSSRPSTPPLFPPALCCSCSCVGGGEGGG